MFEPGGSTLGEDINFGNFKAMQIIGAENGGEALSEEPQYGAQIDDQCFNVNLKPLGDVFWRADKDF